MNKKGFTLIETIMVIAILALLMLILVPNVIVLINKNNIKSCHNLEDSIINATKMYVTNNKYELGFSCPSTDSTSKINVSIEKLIESGDLKLSTDKLTNPKDDSEIKPDNTSVEVTYDCNTKEFAYDFSICE
ncbi:MAG: prepilin-type N-terminal cleavage/methylation domain-containing protein [Bacilli bacterium]